MKHKSSHRQVQESKHNEDEKNARPTLEVKQIEVLYAFVLAKRNMENSGLNKCYLREESYINATKLTILWKKSIYPGLF
jgi:hypothetical protein